MEQRGSRSTSQHRRLIVENDIQERIISGEPRDGDQLPREAGLCARYDVSRITIRPLDRSASRRIGTICDRVREAFSIDTSAVGAKRF